MRMKTFPRLNGVAIGQKARKQTPQKIAYALVRALKAASQYLEWQLGQWPAGAKDEVIIENTKVATRLDLGAEEIFKWGFHATDDGAFDEFLLLGEESIREGLDLRGSGAVFILADVLDGTKNGFHLGWHYASTATVVDTRAPSGSRILASAIVMPGGDPAYVYYQGAPSVVVLKDGRERNVFGTSGRTDLPGAAIAFVGQSDDAHNSFAELSNALGRDVTRYDIAGLPMVPRFIDVGRWGVGVDVLAELRGQLAHDASPLLLMAMKAGAHVITPEGIPMDFATVEEALLRPADARLRYVAASSKTLAETVVNCLGRSRLELATSSPQGEAPSCVQ